MKRMGSTISLMLCLPQAWLALAGAVVAIVGSHWEPLMDIVIYAVQRLSQ